MVIEIDEVQVRTLERRSSRPRPAPRRTQVVSWMIDSSTAGMISTTTKPVTTMSSGSRIVAMPSARSCERAALALSASSRPVWLLPAASSASLRKAGDAWAYGNPAAAGKGAQRSRSDSLR